MAELAVGLSKSVLVGAITKIQLAIDEDSRLRQKVKRDLVFITLEFEMMRSFLDDANQEMKNNLVRTWVKHIRQLAYEVEDCVENVGHLDDHPIFWRRLLPSFLAPALLLDQAVEEIEQLKGRVEDVHNCYRRYYLINIDSAAGAGSKPAAVILLQPEEAATNAAAQATALDMLVKARRYAAEKRQQFLGDLAQLITSKGNDLQVISVWGAGGHHGTTSIILKTYNDPEICHKFTCRAWVKLNHPFNPHHFIQNLMVQFCANSASKQHGTPTSTIGVQVLTKMETTRSQADLLKEFEQLLTKETYLVVLEDLSNMEEWHAIRTFLPHTGSGSRIIVSAQQSEVASLCIGHSYQILELKQYSAEHSVCALFSKEPGFHEVGQSSSYDDRKVAAEWMNNSPLIGRASEMNELRKYAGSAQVMSVWGVAGVGKSAVVRHLYYDRMLQTNLFDKFVWVDVCQPFNLRDFCRSLLLDFHSEKNPIDECRKLLKEHRCFIVIDDLQSKEEWNLLQSALVSESSKSVIIVITNEANIATSCTNNADLVFNIKCLHADAASDLFKQEEKSSIHIEGSHRSGDRRSYFEVWRFPKVIVAIAGLLAKTQNDKLVDTVSSFKRKFMLHLEADPDFYSLRGLFGWMHFIILNPPDFLKPCIFYLSIFPQDYNIRRRRLVRRWIAEGYSTESAGRHMKQNAENFFSELIQLSIFQQVWKLATTSMNNTAIVGFYKVNGFIREYIISRPTEENLVFELEGSCAIAPQHKARHLIISRSWDRDRIVFDSIDFSRLRSLTVFGHWRSFFISESMKMLQVLDLEDASGVHDNDLEQMVKLLRRLKFISLRGCREVCHIPNSIGGLRQLQTLDVRHTSIVALPDSIAELQNIQYIRVGTTFDSPSTQPASSSCLTTFCRRRRLVAVEVPRGVGKLTALHTLGVVNVSASGGKAVVKELKKLTQLRKLGVSGINRKNSEEFISAISGHVHLESLSVQLDKDNQGCLDDISMRWQNLHSLKLYGLQDRLPLSRSHLSQLRKLNLEMATLEENGIEFLAMLPELCILRLSVKQLQNGKLHFYAEMYGEQLLTFQKVKILEIACSSNRLHVTFGSRSMKNLELLTFDCSSAGYQLTGLNNLSELKEVFLKGTDDETIKTTLETSLPTIQIHLL